MVNVYETKNHTYDFTYNSSTTNEKSVLGTIEKDACGLNGKFSPENFRGEKIMDLFLKKDFTTVLDIGGGGLEASEQFLNNGKTVDVSDYEDGLYIVKSKVDRSLINKFVYGDFCEAVFDKQYDAIWCAHVLEHQLNPNIFLKKIFSILKEGGWMAITIPPRKPIIVGGHVSIWNAGLLLYHLVHAGFDCSDAKVIQYDYNIGIVLQKKSIKDFPKLHYDKDDLIKLNPYFPVDTLTDSFNGDILLLNWN